MGGTDDRDSFLDHFHDPGPVRPGDVENQMSRFPANLFAGRRYAVVGLGRAGIAALRVLTAMGAIVTGWDDAGYAREQAEAEGFLIADPTPDIGDIDALILSPGIPHRLPVPHRIAAAAIAAGRPILTDAELLFQAVRGAGSRARFVGITGTNGKSTTTALLAHILATAHVPHAAGANLGPAALSLPLLPDSGVYVLEMSSYMLERLATLRFDAAAMLNLSPDHLDRHGDMAGYTHAKQQIFARQTDADKAVIGIDDEPGRALHAAMPRARTISGAHEADMWCDGVWLRDASGKIADMAQAHALPGPHNAQNAAAAAALALALDVSRAAIAEGITTFPGLAHRQELVGTVSCVRFINDSKATNADATARALACYDRLIWIAGGIAKEGGIAPLTEFFPRVAGSFLIGRDAAGFAATLERHHVAHQIVETLDRAVPAALAAARAAGVDVVLLSPACASFDQFSGFEARGARFRELVALQAGQMAGVA
jgi:UDP-N-acetylmuramoylalanine--D-glutamate ligase